MTALLAGRLELSGFAALAAQHFFIYSALESVAETWRHDQLAGPFVIAELHRVPALQHDLERLYGTDWRDQITPIDATLDYCTRLAQIDTPAQFVAHHYTRYLGDISGGQVIRSHLRRQYDLNGAGATFYDFSNLYAAGYRNPAEFRRRYRGLLDSPVWTDAGRATLITEARLAFDHNRAVFDDLAGTMDRFLIGEVH